MSYILDALRKADAERERGQVPDLHAQPVLRGSVNTEPTAGARPWIWIATGAAIVALATLAWALLGREVPREPVATVAVAPGGAGMPTPSITGPAPTPAPAPAPTPVAAAPVMAPAPVVVAPALPPAVIRPAPEPARPVARKPALAQPAAEVEPVAPAREARIYAPSELPDDIRRELPALAIGGAMYSENPANRMLIINGQVFHERDKLSPKLTLVQIKLKAAVLEFKGYRYSISY